MSERFTALVLDEADGKVSASIKTLTDADLPAGDVTVAISHSTLNYKDGMIVNGLGRLVRRYPHVPGIDFAGTVEASSSPDYKPGDQVLLTGWRVGEVHWGGYAQKARVDAGWLVAMPDGLDARRAMAVGTAGFTAMLAVIALEEHAVTPDAGEVLVTGAAGGVGSVAVAILSKLGYRVTAATGRPEAHDYLTGLGAGAFIDRAELAEPSDRPLESERWAGSIDAVGGTTLSRVLAQMAYGGSVAACGLAGGVKLETTVIPLLLRAVKLIGIDSVMQPLKSRRRAWARIVRDLPMDKLDAMTTVAPLAEVPKWAGEILKGRIRGRLVIDVNA
ncbi:MAG: MDR family oxidoreductase [Kiloniellales bacterium]